MSTVEKCRRILNFYDEIEPRKQCINPIPARMQSRDRLRSSHSNSNSKSKSKSISVDFSFSKNQHASCSSSLSRPQQLTAQFVTSYNKESRLDKIMRLKVKPVAVDSQQKRTETKKSFLNTSLGASMHSSRSSHKENISSNPKQKQSRLDRIMNIKVPKPNAHSTLLHYQPRQGSKSEKKPARESAVKEWKQCAETIKKASKQQDREDRLWRVFERERELREKLKRQADERLFKETRRQEKRFESLVHREMSKIDSQKQQARLKEAFSYCG